MPLSSEVQGLKPVVKVLTELLHDVVVFLGRPIQLHFVTHLAVSAKALEYTLLGIETRAVDVQKRHLII